MKDLVPLIQEAVSSVKIIPRSDQPHPISMEQRVKLILVKLLAGESNRMFANILAVFSMLSSIDISYKTVERLYSNGEIIVTIHNLHPLILKGKNVKK